MAMWDIGVTVFLWVLVVVVHQAVWRKGTPLAAQVGTGRKSWQRAFNMLNRSRWALFVCLFGARWCAVVPSIANRFVVSL